MNYAYRKYQIHNNFEKSKDTVSLFVIIYFPDFYYCQDKFPYKIVYILLIVNGK